MKKIIIIKLCQEIRKETKLSDTSDVGNQQPACLSKGHVSKLCVPPPFFHPQLEKRTSRDTTNRMLVYLAGQREP